MKISKYTSHFEPVNCGVPQGTVLGPILFMIMLMTYWSIVTTGGNTSTIHLLPKPFSETRTQIFKLF